MVMVIITFREIAMLTKLMSAAFAVLLIASASTAFAQKAPVAQGSDQNAAAAQTGPYDSMNRPY
jgi:hypothetical protein